MQGTDDTLWTRRGFLGAGFVLGLGGHSPDPNDVMYVSHDPNADVLLSARDINTIKTLYYSLFP